MNQEKIDRINTLYHKSQAVGLTEEEKAEYQPLLLSWLNSIEEALSGAKLNFTDGTSFAIPVIVHMPFEDGWAKGVTYWKKTININAIESVEIMGQTVGIRQG